MKYKSVETKAILIDIFCKAAKISSNLPSMTIYNVEPYKNNHIHSQKKRSKHTNWNNSKGLILMMTDVLCIN